MQRKRGFFHNKKGLEHETFFTMFDVVLAVVVFLALMDYVVDVQKQTIFERNYIARDTAILINTLSAAPGDVSYTYLESLSSRIEKQPYIFDFSSSRVSIKSQEEGNTVQYPYAQSDNTKASFSPSPTLVGQNALTFTKNKDGIAIKPVSLNLPNDK